MAADDPKDSKKNEEHSSDWDLSDEGRKGVTDTLKKLFTVGLGAAFMTEDAIRNYLGEIKLPKEMIGYLMTGAKKSKEELMNRVGNEVVTIIRKIDFVQEASRFVESHKFRVSAEIEVVKKDNNESNSNIKVTLNK